MHLTGAGHWLAEKNPAFWGELRLLTKNTESFEDWIVLSALRRKALKRGLAAPWAQSAPLRFAILGGYSLYPLREILTHALEMMGISSTLFVGDYDNYVSEIMDAGSALHTFSPEVIFLLPGHQRCKYIGKLTDPPELVRSEAGSVTLQLLDLCQTAHRLTSADIILANFILPARYDPGAFRVRTPASDWSFRKLVNMELGLSAPAFVQICDLEFLANRYGALAAEDARGWFESKQPCSSSFLVPICREIARLIAGLREPTKKVIVLDLDNTLWGGVVAEDGLDGIEIGDTSPRGEAFKAFQAYLLTLKNRGILLTVCSKNDYARAVEPFEQHPEMVLRLSDFAAFKANWDPKSDNLRQIAAELDLGLDSFVFVDDNPAETDVVSQFAPAVTPILLSADPSEYGFIRKKCV